jgi:hypothetical protein
VLVDPSQSTSRTLCTKLFSAFPFLSFLNSAHVAVSHILLFAPDGAPGLLLLFYRQLYCWPDSRKISTSLQAYVHVIFQQDPSARYFSTVRADSDYTSRFRSVAERHRSLKFSHVYLNGDVHTERNVSVTSQFRSVAVAERECLTWRNGSGPVCTCSILILWTVLRLLHYTSVLACNECCPFLSSENSSPDEPGILRNRVCDANSASARASESAQLYSSTSSNMATYYRQFPSELNM